MSPKIEKTAVDDLGWRFRVSYEWDCSESPREPCRGEEEPELVVTYGTGGEREILRGSGEVILTMEKAGPLFGPAGQTINVGVAPTDGFFGSADSETIRASEVAALLVWQAGEKVRAARAEKEAAARAERERREQAERNRIERQERAKAEAEARAARQQQIDACIKRTLGKVCALVRADEQHLCWSDRGDLYQQIARGCISEAHRGRR